MKTYKIHLIRHGLTQANIDGVYCGSTDLPLSGEGVQELQQLAGEYTYPLVDIVYTSPMARARQSANILFPGCEQVVVEDLREASFGVYEGRKFSDLQHDPVFQKWVSFGSEDVPEGAEHHEDFADRTASAFVNIVTNMMQDGIPSAAVVTHAGVIGSILAALAYPKKSPYDWQTYTGCGYTVSADPSLFLRDPVVEVVALVPKELEDELD